MHLFSFFTVAAMALKPFEFVVQKIFPIEEGRLHCSFFSSKLTGS